MKYIDFFEKKLFKQKFSIKNKYFIVSSEKADPEHVSERGGGGVNWNR